VDRWLEVFPREQVLIVLFDDLRADTPGTMRRVFEWMGVDADVEVDLTPRNPNVAVGSVRLQRLVHFPPGSMQRVVRAVAPPRVRLALRHFALRRNQTEASRQELSDATRRHLCEVYREDVQRLEEVTGRDLSAWITA
jgi:hypothetical protein